MGSFAPFVVAFIADLRPSGRPVGAPARGVGGWAGGRGAIGGRFHAASVGAGFGAVKAWTSASSGMTMRIEGTRSGRARRR